MRLISPISFESEIIATFVLESCSLCIWLAILFHETINANVYLSDSLFLIEDLTIFSRNFPFLLFDGLLFLLEHLIYLSQLLLLSLEFLCQFCFRGCLALTLRIWNLLTDLKRLFELFDRLLLFFMTLLSLYILLETATFIFWPAN